MHHEHAEHQCQQSVSITREAFVRIQNAEAAAYDAKIRLESTLKELQDSKGRELERAKLLEQAHTHIGTSAHQSAGTDKKIVELQEYIQTVQQIAEKKHQDYINLEKMTNELGQQLQQVTDQRNSTFQDFKQMQQNVESFPDPSLKFR